MKIVLIFYLLCVAGALPTREREEAMKELEVIEWGVKAALHSDRKSIVGSTPLQFKNSQTKVIPSDLGNCRPCKCGYSRRSKNVKIAGGHDVKNVNKYPWVAQLVFEGTAFCGGSLISSRYVLTAAHCVFDIVTGSLSIRLLEHDTSTETESTPIVVNVDRIIMHKGFTIKTVDNDIALLRLDRQVELDDQEEKASPVCLPKKGNMYSGIDGVAIGWGAKTFQGSEPSTLQEVTVPIITNEQCRRKGWMHSRYPITSNMICAGYPEERKGVCKGDSGGPLMIKNKSSYYLVGITSFGKFAGSCENKGAPDVYARVDRYLDWILDNTRDSCHCTSTKI